VKDCCGEHQLPPYAAAISVTLLPCEVLLFFYAILKKGKTVDSLCVNKEPYFSL